MAEIKITEAKLIRRVVGTMNVLTNARILEICNSVLITKYTLDDIKWKDNNE